MVDAPHLSYGILFVELMKFFAKPVYTQPSFIKMLFITLKILLQLL